MHGAAIGYHAHEIVVDDPHLVSKAESDLERDAVLSARCFLPAGYQAAVAW
jgi:hypothetical protein